MIKENLSIILPCYNAEKYLSDCLESICNQTLEHFEVIAIDDGSTDSTWSILQEYSQQDTRFKIIRRENLGLIATLNEAIMKSDGDFIARMDADDICVPTRFEIQLSEMQRRELDICGSHYLAINNLGQGMFTYMAPINPVSCLLGLSQRCILAHPSVMIRRSFLEKHGLHYGIGNYSNAEDYSLWLHAIDHDAKVANIDEILIKYRIHDLNLSKRNKIKLRRENRLLKKEFIPRIIKRFEAINYNVKIKNLPPQDAIIFMEYYFRFKFKSFCYNLRAFYSSHGKRSLLILIYNLIFS